MALTIPQYTVDDLDRFPDDGNRYELLDGVLLVTPLANHEHQVIATRLIVALSAGVKGGRVVGPGVIAHPPRTQLEPDVLVYPSRFPAKSKWTDITEHWLAVEIFIPSSRVYDREFKRGAYLELGVREVWLVDVDEQTVEVSRRTEEIVVEREVVTWRAPASGSDLVIDLRMLFAGLA